MPHPILLPQVLHDIPFGGSAHSSLNAAGDAPPPPSQRGPLRALAWSVQGESRKLWAAYSDGDVGDIERAALAKPSEP
ncbi:hypothetical protein GUJ93_ZPchr0001g31839 [Zizania palustris]|uniref:Uncharacterized protein n=1 Tax=Zizania palustris TaxID=103762 RepID=A0A8J5VT65_ZIZPA|nr:hypothetical protein GUJ93_ZPchr0001g31839 [Zizania palustris]